MSMKDIFSSHKKKPDFMSSKLRREEESENVPMIKLEFALKDDGKQGIVGVAVSNVFKQLCQDAEKNVLFDFEEQVQKPLERISENFSREVLGLIGNLIADVFDTEFVGGIVVSDNVVPTEDVIKLTKEIDESDRTTEDKERLKEKISSIVKEIEIEKGKK